MKADNVALKAENAELKARLKLDSHNSSKPPSSDGLHKRTAFPKERISNQGGQKDHQGNTLKMVYNPDHINVHRPQICDCGHDLLNEPISIIAHRQVFDLPEPKLEVSYHQISQVKCPECRLIHRGQFPSGVNAPTQYGVGVKAFVTLLNTEYKLPYDKIQSLFEDMFGYAINESTVTSANNLCYDKLAASEKVIQDRLIASSVVHADNTSKCF